MSEERRLIGRRAELQRLLSGIRPASIRVVPVVVGPSGIGKTSLAREAAGQLHREGYLTYHFYVAERVRTLGDLYRVLTSRAGVVFSTLTLDVLRGLASRILERLYGSDWKHSLNTAAALLERSIYDALAEFFLELARRARRSGQRGVVVFIDEAQNLLRGMEPGEVWSFVKMLASLQEELPAGDAAGFQAVLITSEYGFQRRLLRYSPSLDYIDTFYLGEMTREDAFSLYQYFKGGKPGPEEARLIDEAVGGHPVHLGFAAKRGLGAAVCRYVRQVQQAVAEYEGEGAEAALRHLVEEPLPRTRSHVKLLDGLVKRGVLQYACRAYLGVYEWNPGCGGNKSDGGEEYSCGGGGWCGGLDVVAPSSRLARLGIALAAGRPDAVPGSVRGLCRLP